MEKSTTS
uniref:Uncharacterized protein n=1 Tax=Oryza glumipatula TaxID=40148 RepID=A0A1Y8Z5H8_9ORYZ